MGVKDGDKIMKKILSVLFLTASVISLCACSSQSKQPAASTENGYNMSDSIDDAGEDDNINTSSDTLDNIGSQASESNTPELAETQDNEQLQQGSSDQPQQRSTMTAVSSSSANVKVSKNLDTAVSKAIVSYNSGSYLDGECEAEGHIILDVSHESSKLKVYALTMYGEYSFINDMFIKVSGSGAIPVVMVFDEDKDDTYSLVSYQEPEDGSKYVSSVKELFPQSIYSRIVPISETDNLLLTANERKNAKAYLDSIGRSANIGNYSDLTLEYPDVSQEIEATVFDRYWEYPDWIGTTEKIENDVRYVYETQWKNYGNNDSMIYLTKYVYDTGEIIRTINVHIDEGKIQSSEEKVLRLIENTSSNK